MTNTSPAAAASLVLPLGEACTLSTVGGKALNLARLQRLKVPGAPGCVITSHAFEAHLHKAGLLEETRGQVKALQILGREEIRALARRWQAAIVQTPLAEDLVSLLRDHTAQWLPQALAVRSSAVGEDSGGASFAGQLDTVLDVSDFDGVLQAVRRVWASAYSEHCLQYARTKGRFLCNMGVVVQRQVRAQLAGVLFTREPTDEQSPSMLLEYCEGLGERLVSGQTNPGRARLSRERGTVATLTLLEAGDEPALTKAHESQLRNLRDLALSLEEQLGGPQDIEWVVDADGALSILQARPITRFVPAAPLPRSLRAPTWGPRTAWSNANVAENFPHPLTPLLYSIVRQGYSAYFRELARGFGFSAKVLQARQRAFDHIVGVHAGRLYYNLSSIHDIILLAPGGKALARYFNEFTGACAYPGIEPAKEGILLRTARLCRIAAATTWRYLTVHHRVERFERRVSQYAQDTHPHRLEKATPAQLDDALNGFLTLRLRQWNDAALADTAAMTCYGLLQRLLAPWSRAGSATHNDLLKGLPGLVSSEPVNKLWDLAQEVRQCERTKAVLLRDSSSDAWQYLKAAPEDSPEGRFRSKFELYLETWGFRSSEELTLAFPTPHENPVPTLRILQMYLREDAGDPRELSHRQAAEREHATRLLCARMSGRLSGVPLLSAASRFRMLLGATQGAIALRERVRFKQALLYTRLRHVLLAIGQELACRGLIAAKEDVFYLPVDEVTLLLNGNYPYPETLENVIATRKAAHVQANARQPPDSFTSPSGQFWAENGWSQALPAVGEDDITGTSACGGKAQGKAAVILDVSQADQIEAGDILVTRQTDPGWASVFFLVKGLVIERGGMLSHGAIIAREYGIPALVGVPEATRRIKHGQAVTLDADEGVVHAGQ